MDYNYSNKIKKFKCNHKRVGYLCKRSLSYELGSSSYDTTVGKRLKINGEYKKTYIFTLV
jgi:hypothetical protein